ncbi:MAG: adenylosuccinate synthase [Synergistaceae bacterium]|nr:adenylosuccinate synthase [Synergistaceae bacterium]
MKGRVEAIIGAQWGDEGKGRVIDALGDRFDIFARYQGGANAGHTVIVDDKKFVFHLLPSGMLYHGKLCVIGNGVVLDPELLLAEMKELQEKGMDRARLIISRVAHVVMPYHKILDKAQEDFRGKGHRLGTTSRGIGPCYVDKYTRSGLRLEDIVNEDKLRSKLEPILEEKNMTLTRLYNQSPIAFDEVFNMARQWGRELSPYLADTSYEISEAVGNGKNILLEGAQGTLLDIDHGTYPYVTSSSPVSAGGCLGLGIPPKSIDRVLAVVKSYSTRVGEGPMPTEDDGETGKYLREKGGEYGATTGRPRRCGWMDMVALSYSMRINGTEAVILTKLDVLTGLDVIKFCTAYEVEGSLYHNFRSEVEFLSEVKPIYEDIPGWTENISECRKFEELPSAAQNYVRIIEEHCKVPVVFIGVGPQRHQSIDMGL